MFGSRLTTTEDKKLTKVSVLLLFNGPFESNQSQKAKRDSGNEVESKRRTKTIYRNLHRPTFGAVVQNRVKLTQD